MQMSRLSSDAGGVAGRALVAARVDGAQIGEGQDAGIGVHLADGDGRQWQQESVGHQRIDVVAPGDRLSQTGSWTQWPSVFLPAEIERFVALADAAQQPRPDALFEYLIIRLDKSVDPRWNWIP